MSLLTLFFALNATLLILHEIESGYEKEWEILRLPFKLTGFLVLHIPILLILFYGVLEVEKQSTAGQIIGIISGAGGFIPFLVHKLLFKKRENFSLPVSNLIIYGNMVTGLITIILSINAK